MATPCEISQLAKKHEEWLSKFRILKQETDCKKILRRHETTKTRAQRGIQAGHFR